MGHHKPAELQKISKLDTLEVLHSDLNEKHGKFLDALAAFRNYRDKLEFIYTPKQIKALDGYLKAFQDDKK